MMFYKIEAKDRFGHTVNVDLLLDHLRRYLVRPTLINKERKFVIVKNTSLLFNEDLKVMGYTVAEHNPYSSEARVENFADLFKKYAEQPVAIKTSVRDMVAIINDEKATPEERKSAAYTLQEVFYGERS